MGYYVGIDGGGTKSRLVAVDTNRKVVGEALGGSTNLSSNSRTEVWNNLNDLFSEGFEKNKLEISDCLGLCIGSAGLDSSRSKDDMVRIIQEMGFACPISAVNDSQLVLAAATKGEPGVVVISGTGSIAYGLDENGNTIRCGGWGHLIDDGGSGYWMGKEALKAALCAFDGRGPQTVLVDMFKREFKIETLSDCVDIIYRRLNKSDISRYSFYVEKGAMAEDKVCISIVRNAARELFNLADAVLKRLGSNDLSVIVSGGNILNNKLLNKMFVKIMKEAYPRVLVVELSQKPVTGAVHLAMECKRAVERKV